MISKLCGPTNGFYQRIQHIIITDLRGGQVVCRRSNLGVDVMKAAVIVEEILLERSFIILHIQVRQ